MKKYKVIHTRKKCIGCNSCVTIAPQNWVMDEKDGKATLLFGKEKKDVYVAEIFEDDYDANCQAAAACPMRIIKVEK
jgi:ferredoxin